MADRRAAACYSREGPFIVKRKRYKKGTLGHHVHIAPLAERVERLWQEQNAAARAADIKPRKAKERATAAVAEVIGRTSGRVHQLRRYYAREVEPAIRMQRQTVHALRPAFEEMQKDIEALHALLSPEEMEDLWDLPTGSLLMRRLITGARAQKRVSELEREMKRLRTQLAADAAVPGFGRRR